MLDYAGDMLAGTFFRYNDCMLIPDAVVYTSLGETIYVEADNNCVSFVFKDSVIECRMKFAAAVKMVDEVSSDFCKCHRSYYVSLAHVKKLGSGEVVMDNGDVIPVARSAAADMKKNLFDYIRRAGR